MGNGKSEIGSFADYTLKKSSLLSAYRRRRLLFHAFRCFVDRLAPAALVNNEIDGLILDTTFKVIRQYHIMILFAIIQNVRLPLGVSFRPQESVD
jgi:hypothetical protein